MGRGWLGYDKDGFPANVRSKRGRQLENNDGKMMMTMIAASDLVIEHLMNDVMECHIKTTGYKPLEGEEELKIAWSIAILSYLAIVRKEDDDTQG